MELNKIVYSLAELLSEEEGISVYDKTEFFDKLFDNNNARLEFCYNVSKDLWGGDSWTDGYFANTVSKNGSEKAIVAYVRD